MKERTEVISIRISKETKAALERLAKADRRPLSQYVAVVLEKHIEAAKPERTRD